MEFFSNIVPKKGKFLTKLDCANDAEKCDFFSHFSLMSQISIGFSVEKVVRASHSTCSTFFVVVYTLFPFSSHLLLIKPVNERYTWICL